MAKSGATPQQVDEQVRRLLPTLSVTPREMRAITLFARCQTQWNHSPMGGLLSLNYQGVETVARALHLDLDADLLRDLQVMENEVVKRNVERGKRNRKP